MIRTTLASLFLLIGTVSPLLARDAVTAAEVNGTFTDKSTGSAFQILALGNNKLQVSFSGVYPYKTPQGEDMANIGEAAGTAEIQADKATFKPEGFAKTCKITIVFTAPGELSASQEGDSPDCGFGFNVRADGNYKKTSAKKPKRL